MALKTLIAGATDLSDAANWGGTLPVATDSMQIVEGNQHISAGFSFSSGLNFAGVFIGPNAGVTFADDWQFNCTAGTVNHAGSGELRLDGTLNLVMATGQGRAKINGGALTTGIAQKGPLQITDQATANILYSVLGDIEIAAHASDRVDELYIGQGRVSSERDIEIGTIGTGRLTLLEDATISDGAGGGVLTIDGGGELRLNGNPITIDEIKGVFGVINPQQSRGDIAITDSSLVGVSIIAGADGSFPGGTLTFTNPASPSAPGVIPFTLPGGATGIGI